MTDPHHDAAAAFERANPVPDPATLPLRPLGDVLDRAPSDPSRALLSARPAAADRPSGLRRVLATAAVVAAVAVVAAALTSRRPAEVTIATDEAPSSTAAPSSSDVVDAPGAEWDDLPAWASASAGPGPFRSLFFEPALRFELDATWAAAEEGSNTTGSMRPLAWSGSESSSAIYFYSHDNLDDTVVEGPPSTRELIDRLERHESTTNVRLTTVEIGGVEATKVDFDLVANLLYVRTRGVDGANILHDFEASSEVAVYVLDVRGSTVSIVLESLAPADLGALEEHAGPVLESIVWHEPER